MSNFNTERYQFLNQIYRREKLMESELSYAFSAAFIGLALWSAKLRLRNRKLNNTFVAMLVTTSVAFGATILDYPLIDKITTDYKIEQINADNLINVTAYFSPQQGSTKRIVEMIQASKKSIYVAAYSFTSEPIASALITAYNNGIDVQIVLDKSQRTAKYSAYSLLKKFNIPTRINNRYAIMHNKFMIVDGNMLQTGSFNYTKAAEFNNAENVILLSNNETTKQYMQQWQKLWNESS